jgi:hypothetical protein
MECRLCGHDQTHKHGKKAMIGEDTNGYFRLKFCMTIGKDQTPRLEYTNGIFRQQTGR